MDPRLDPDLTILDTHQMRHERQPAWLTTDQEGRVLVSFRGNIRFYLSLKGRSSLRRHRLAMLDSLGNPLDACPHNMGLRILPSQETVALFGVDDNTALQPT